MKTAILILVTILSIIFSNSIYASTSYNVDLEVLQNMDATSRSKYIDGLVKQYVEKKSGVDLPKVSSDEAKEWASIISGAIKTICTDLSVGVNEFLKTDAGKITTFLIAYKVIGQDIRNIVLGTSAWVVITLLLFSIFWLTIMPKKVKIYNEKKQLTEIQYIKRLDIEDLVKGWISGVLAAMFIAETITSLILVFGK